MKAKLLPVHGPGAPGRRRLLRRVRARIRRDARSGAGRHRSTKGSAPHKRARFRVRPADNLRHPRPRRRPQPRRIRAHLAGRHRHRARRSRDLRVPAGGRRPRRARPDRPRRVPALALRHPRPVHHHARLPRRGRLGAARERARPRRHRRRRCSRAILRGGTGAPRARHRTARRGERQQDARRRTTASSRLLPARFTTAISIRSPSQTPWSAAAPR